MKPLCTLFLTSVLGPLCIASPIEIAMDNTAAAEARSINETVEYSVGMSCNDTSCDEILLNVKCDERTKTCECENDYPIPLVRKNGCVQPIQLGDQCMYSESCVASDAYSTCIQVRYNAYCRCIPGYREISGQKNSKAYCSKDILRIAQDLPALLIAISGIAVFSTIICFVLKLFVGQSRRTHQERPITTRLLSTSEIAQVARSFRRADRPTAYSRKGSRGVTVSSSRATAARAAAILLVSCHIRDQEVGLSRKLSDPSGASLLQRSEKSSPRSFSAKQFKRESDQRLARNRRQISMQLMQPSTSGITSDSTFPSAEISDPKIKPRSLSCDNVSDYEFTCEELRKTHHRFSADGIID